MAKKEIVTEETADTKKNKNKSGLTIEEVFLCLDETIKRLESDDISLEDSLKAYEEGMAYIRSCNKAIDKAEKKVMVIRENGELDEF